MNVAVDTPMADVDAWGWQGSRKAIKDRAAYMLDHSPIPFNVNFEVGLPGKRVIIIEAHKDILAMGSEVFLKMFHGGLARNDHIIKIPDTDPSAFRLMMRFLYTEELSTELMENDITVAFEVMKCAGKYGVPHLYIRCRQWILEHFVEHFTSRKNVEGSALLYLQLALKIEYEDQKILDAIWNVIDVCTESVVKTPDEVLRDVSLDVVTVFLARDSLTVPNELHLYDFLTRWMKLATTGPNPTELTMGERLGEAIKNIRFTEMDMTEFSNGPVADEVLTLEETVQVYRHHFSPVVDEEFSFISQPRKSSAPPTMLAIDTKFFPGKQDMSGMCEFEPFTDFTIEIGKLHPDLLRLVKTLQAPRSIGISSAAWSCVEDSNLSTFTVRFGQNFVNDSGSTCDVSLEELQPLKKSIGQVVNLGFGDVAMEVAYSEYRVDHKTMVFRLDSIDLIFGGFSNSAYASCSKRTSVFYLGHIVSGTTDFSFLRRFMEPGKHFPAYERMLFSTKFCDMHDEDPNDEDGEDDSEEQSVEEEQAQDE